MTETRADPGTVAQPPLRRRKRGADNVGTPPPRERERTGLWHRPALLNLISDLLTLFAVVGLGWALVAWFVSRPLFPLREVILLSSPAQVAPEQLEYVARTAIRGNFFTVDLQAVRTAFEGVPWVRHAEVRRRWPDGIELSLEEQRAVAYWAEPERGDVGLVNSQGEVFVGESDAPMPRFSGPQGSAAWLLARHAEFSEALSPLGARLVGVALSAREAWQLKLDNGLVILLGREQDKAPVNKRLARFVAAWPRVSEGVGAQQIVVADLRYPSGFALTPAAGTAAGGASKGK